MSGEKTHDPTHKRLSDARKRGEVSQGKELPILLKYGVLLVLLSLTFDHSWELIRNFFSACFSVVSRRQMMPSDALFEATAKLLLHLLMLWVLPCVVAGLAGILVQIGILFSPQAAAPSFKKFNVVGNIAQMFSMQSLLTFLVSLLKVVVYTVVAGMAVVQILPDILSLALIELSGIGDYAVGELRSLIFKSLMLFLAFAAFDVWLTRYFFMKKMRMSHQDLIDEYKQSEGDPHLKGERRHQHRSLLESSLNRVGGAKLLVNNPTHISVALDYEPGVHDLPFILAMGSDDIALLMRRKAMEAGVPLVTHIPLARALYRDGEVDAYIPSAHVALTAAVFREVMNAIQQSAAKDDLQSETPGELSSPPESLTTKDGLSEEPHD